MSPWERLTHPWRIPLDGAEPVGGAIIAVGATYASDVRAVRASLSRPATLFDPDETSLATAAQWAKEGQLLITYPEGRAAPSGICHRAATWLGALVMSAKVPVVPAAVVGGDDVIARLPGPISVAGASLRLGEPMDFSRLWSLDPVTDIQDACLMREIADEVMMAIVSLAGVPYVDNDRDEAATAAHRTKLTVASLLARRRAYRETEEKRRAVMAKRAAQEAQWARELDREAQEELERAAEAAARYARHQAALDDQAKAGHD